MERDLRGLDQSPAIYIASLSFGLPTRAGSIREQERMGCQKSRDERNWGVRIGENWGGLRRVRPDGREKRLPGWSNAQ